MLHRLDSCCILRSVLILSLNDPSRPHIPYIALRKSAVAHRCRVQSGMHELPLERDLLYVLCGLLHHQGSSYSHYSVFGE